MTILVATWEDGLYTISADGRRAKEFASQTVRGLAPDGCGDALAIIGGHSLRRRAPDGKWSTIASSEFELSCCMAVGETIYVGTDDARMLRLSHGRLEPIDAFDHVAGRETWFAGSAIVNGQRIGPPLGIRSLAANSNGSVLFANVHVGGIPRSMDGGKTWEPTIEVQSDVHEVRAHPTDPSLIAAASAVGLCISRDGGATWAIESDGLHAPHCSAVAFSGNDILVSSATDPFTDQGRIYRRPIGPDERIVALADGLPDWLHGGADTSCITTSGSTIVFVDKGGTLYVSTQLGRVWSRSDELPMPSGVLIC